MSRSDPVTSVLENEEGLYHPGTSVQNRSDDFGPRECSGIASSLNFILERYPEASVPESVVGLHDP